MAELRRRRTTSAANPLRRVDRTRLNATGRAILDSALAQNRPIQAGSVPRASDVAAAVLRRGSAPRSVSGPQNVALRALIPNIVEQSTAGRAVGNAIRRQFNLGRAPKGKGPQISKGPNKGPFKPNVKLNPNRVTDQRGAAREGASSATSAPRPYQRPSNPPNPNRVWTRTSKPKRKVGTAPR
jgi:hypothetical protein